ncbi:MAG: CopG family transcriptional regulator [Candidatus Omnitrophica bacterium]|nr:CopG family transcriptional regulator [Candidatus Omnitrophota bacterium]
MSKTVTIRLSDEDYKAISSVAEHERRPISNFITHRVMEAIADMNKVDDVEMREILSDEKVMKSIGQGQKQFGQRKGRFVV